jgi:hypothetical protein
MAYREEHPEYAARNRSDQRARNAKRPGSVIAKMDASTTAPSLLNGLYELRPLEGHGFAKMVAWKVQITVLAMTVPPNGVALR